MNDEKRKALESAGWKLGDAGDFLELNEDERKMVAEKSDEPRTLDSFLDELPEDRRKAIDARSKELSEGRIYEFTLILDTDEMTEEMANKLYEAGCDDASLARNGGETKLTFDRSAESFIAALWSAYRDVGNAGYRVIKMTVDGSESIGFMESPKSN